MNKEKYGELMETIEKIQVNSFLRTITNNRKDLHMKWLIGKHLQEMDEKLGTNEEYITKWAQELTSIYGDEFNETNLKLMQEFYNAFKNNYIISSKITWPYIVELLTIKDENARNYYLNETLDKSLTLFDLHKVIINDNFNNLSNKKKKSIKIKDDILNFSLKTGEIDIKFVMSDELGKQCHN